MKFGRKRRDGVAVDLTPLIDVVFQLVIFFAVSTTFITRQGMQRAIQVDLPRASAREAVDEEKSLRVTVNSEGLLYLDDQPVDLDVLGGRFAQAATEPEPPVVVIKADRRVAHGLVVTVMDLAQRAGLRRLSVATDPQGH